MKNWIRLFVGTCCALTLGSIAMPAHAVNLLLNPGFESGSLGPWAGVGGLGPNATIIVRTPDNGPFAPGTHHAFLDNRAEANGLTLAQTTSPGSAIPGQVFYSFDLKSGPTSNGGVFFVEIFAQNIGGAVIGGSGLLGNFANPNWGTFGGSFVAPAGTDHLTIQFEAPTGAVIGSQSSMQVDNAVLQQVTVTPTHGTTWSRVKSLYR